MKTKFMRIFLYFAAFLAILPLHSAVGLSWLPVDIGTSAELYDVWGSDSTNVFIAGDSGAYNGSGNTWTPVGPSGDLRAIWGTSATYIFTVDTYSRIYRFDGSSWTIAYADNQSSIHSIWVDYEWSGEACAVGSDGLILLKSGGAWSEQPSPTAQTLRSVWGTGANDIFAVGDQGTILHCDNATTGAWSLMDSPTTEDLDVVWGCGCYNVYAAGKNGTLLRYDRTAWKEIASGTLQDLYGIWSRNEENVFVVGAGGTIIHYDGQWEYLFMNSGTTENLHAIWGSSIYDMYAVGSGGTVLHFSSPGCTGDNCSCIDNDNDGYGENCLSGPDCDDSDPAVHTGCPTDECALTVIPSTMYGTFNFLLPLHGFIIVGDEDTEFSRSDRPAWDSDAVLPFAKIKIGRRIILSLVFVRPFVLQPGEIRVTVGECTGAFEVK